MSTPASTAAIEVAGLGKSYGSTRAVDDVSFHVGAGEVFGILGPNGAGKTTTVECIAGLRIGDAGRIRVLGLDPWTQRSEVTRLLGVQLQQGRLQEKITVREALDLFSAFYDRPRPWGELTGRLGLDDLLAHRFGRLSGGQQQRLSIALALVGRPQVAILDELSTGLDPRARREVWDLVRELRSDGTTVLLVTHAMEEAQALCDRIAVIDAGRLRALDTPEGLIGGASAAIVVSFEPSQPLDLQSLRELDDVSSAQDRSGRIVVEGAEDAALVVLDLLARHDVVPRRLRVADGTLDAAYLSLTETETETETERLAEEELA